MLDFYLINDEQKTPKHPKQINLRYICGLDSKTFENLKEKGIIDSRFDYYSDFRWRTKLVKEINIKALKNKGIDTDIKKLYLILEKALETKSGIIAYCD